MWFNLFNDVPKVKIFIFSPSYPFALFTRFSKRPIATPIFWLVWKRIREDSEESNESFDFWHTTKWIEPPLILITFKFYLSKTFTINFHFDFRLIFHFLLIRSENFRETDISLQKNNFYFYLTEGGNLSGK